ncbi:hypothetical protein BR63_10980 [Thermanaerosceptrum fracticalcis]|uniref:DUF2680 domain-containing protein n=1 Tax=Thermanaerosceptrum fracticalcis TaxID=1712410 RepID=A0A7G6E3Y1_THEFR|nr:hypothetical protein [Thermanaerosceptrum fracticalcis]QNB46785.1 hypothetical protein BR63_10980 [Thermanaerosceptrum fracticalcis]
MNKNRIFLTVTTVALGLSLVGIANASTMKAAFVGQPPETVQQRVYMNQNRPQDMFTPKNVDAAAGLSQDTTSADSSASSQTTQLSDTNKPFVMGPEMMQEGTASYQQMLEIHKNNQKEMAEFHKNMPQHSMGQGFAGMHNASEKDGSNKSFRGPMGRGMMGR